jgi:hypothetical protein
MDSFSITSFFNNTPAENVPSTQEQDGGNTKGSYCVIAKQENVDVVDYEQDGGNTKGSYCVIA